jgi:hypothetical protein
MLEIDRDRSSAPLEQVQLFGFSDTRQPDHVGTEICEEHARERCRTDPAPFHHPHASERPLRGTPCHTRQDITGALPP